MNQKGIMAIKKFLGKRKLRKPLDQKISARKATRPKTVSTKRKTSSKTRTEDYGTMAENITFGTKPNIPPSQEHSAAKELKIPPKTTMFLEDGNLGLVAADGNEDEITFTVEMTMRNGARLATLSFDEIDLDEQQIEDLEENIEDDVMTAKLPVEVNTNTVSVFIKFVGTPNVSIPVKIKFMNDVIFEGDITITGNGEGVLNKILNL